MEMNYDDQRMLRGILSCGRPEDGISDEELDRAENLNAEELQ